jgi:hypothetical protein
MPSQDLEKMVERAMSDEAFAAKLQTDIEGAMAEYNLSDEEKQALRSRDPAQLQSLGLDERISKRATTMCIELPK